MGQDAAQAVLSRTVVVGPLERVNLSRPRKAARESSKHHQKNSITGKGNSQLKGHRRGMSLCPRNGNEAREVGRKRAERMGEEVREVTGARWCRALTLISRVCFTLNKTETTTGHWAEE